MSRKNNGFTIVELLTVVVIIAILISLLLPSIAMVRRSAKEAAQKAQFASIDIAIDSFKQDYGDYPPSSWPDFIPPPPTFNYCGAQKLAEAMFGWDLMGFHPGTAWRADGYDALGGDSTYDPDNNRAGASLDERTGTYLELATAKVFRLGISAAGENDGLYDLFKISSPFDNTKPNFVICDVFGARRITDSAGNTQTAGTPILYYKADTSKKTIRMNPPTPVTDRIYNYEHNRPLIELGELTSTGQRGLRHPLGYELSGDFPVFYNTQFNYPTNTTPRYGGSGIGYGIRDPKITNPQLAQPYNPDSYILISAGVDGLYGTADDIHNY